MSWRLNVLSLSCQAALAGLSLASGRARVSSRVLRARRYNRAVVFGPILIQSMMQKNPSLFAVSVLAVALIVGGGATISPALAQSLPGGSSASGANVGATRHNLSPYAPSRQTTSQNSLTTEPVLGEGATATGEVCVFCHTPHAGSATPGKPLWNRADSVATYTPYTSSTLNATDLDMTSLATPSKLCLSCHDGTIAIGAVTNAPGSGLGVPITFPAGNFGPTPGNRSVGGTMPYGRDRPDANHGFTRRLGVDMRNDHPISFTYDTALATEDGEMRSPSSNGNSDTPSVVTIADRASGFRPDFPLVGGKVQCSTCHDPHRNTQKFLLKNRLAQAASTQTAWDDWAFSDVNDQICLGCHTRLGKAWAQSAHADPTAANEIYNEKDAALRDFPTGTKVWQAGCLNCHDTHTVAGSRRLLREGVRDTSATPTTTSGIGYTADIRPGWVTTGVSNYNSTSAIENTCYQCHTDGATTNPTTAVRRPDPAISGAGPTNLTASEGVPHIAAEFSRTYRMPITNADQGGPAAGNTVEKHDITDRDGAESQTALGYGAVANRHVECTDCHNPHRVVKADTFLGANVAGGDTSRRTHVPARGTTGNQGNIASGALRGAWGVEPSYTASGQINVTSTSVWMSAGENPSFTEKKGDPAGASTLPVGAAGTNAATYLTREYQLCFKCHSSYANGPLETDFAQLKPSGNTRGGTGSDVNYMARYTNVAAEFAVRATDPPTSGTDQGEGTNVGTACGGADCIPAGTSWDTRTANASTLNHRSWHPVIFPTGRSGAERGNSSFDNIRPPFNNSAKIGLQTMHCSDCHGQSTSWEDGVGPFGNQVQGPHGSDNTFLLKGSWGSTTALADPQNGSGMTSGSLCYNCHIGAQSAQSGFAGDHVPDGNMQTAKCTRCHIAVPHGWKNKAFLANKNCVGKEGGAATDCAATSVGFEVNLLAPPYYINTRNSFSAWRRSREAANGAGYTSESGTCTSGDMTKCPM